MCKFENSSIFIIFASQTLKKLVSVKTFDYLDLLGKALIHFWSVLHSNRLLNRDALHVKKVLSILNFFFMMFPVIVRFKL